MYRQGGWLVAGVGVGAALSVVECIDVRVEFLGYVAGKRVPGRRVFVGCRLVFVWYLRHLHKIAPCGPSVETLWGRGDMIETAPVNGH